MIEKRLSILEKKILELEDRVKYYEEIIPSRYKKAFYKPGESPFFKHEDFKRRTPKIFTLHGKCHDLQEIYIPEVGSKDMEECKRRMYNHISKHFNENYSR